MTTRKSAKRAGQTPSRIPEFANYEEEAAFWDTHDFTEFEDEFEPVKVVVADKLSESVTIPLDDRSFKKLRAQARAEGLNPEALVHRWVLERLDAKPA